MTSQQQKNFQKISQKYVTMRSDKKTIQVDFFMNSIVYNVITFDSFAMFHLTMRELLANWDSSSNDLVVLFDNIVDFHSTSIANVEFDTINFISLLIDYVKSINVFSFEKFIAMLIIDEKELNNYNDVTRSLYFSQWLKAMRNEFDFLLKNHI